MSDMYDAQRWDSSICQKDLDGVKEISLCGDGERRNLHVGVHWDYLKKIDLEFYVQSGRVSPDFPLFGMSHFMGIDCSSSTQNLQTALDAFSQTNCIEDFASSWPMLNSGGNVSTDSSDCTTLISRWLKDCMETHDNCPKPKTTTTTLPTLVIHVRSPAVEPYLLESRAKCAEYAEFSHCWGKMIPFTTTSSTIEERTETIPFTKLPKNFQDAILTTRNLGLSYIWIDSLCIIQDSEEDWERESAVMDSVYANALITIAADGAADSHVGCFLGGESRNSEVSIKCIAPDGSQSQVNVREWPCLNLTDAFNHYKGSELPRSKLCTRAWALQERVPAPKKLH